MNLLSEETKTGFPIMSDQRTISVELNGEVHSLLLKINSSFINEKPVMKMELSCQEDLTFLKHTLLDEDTFNELMTCQKVSIPFNSFITQFLFIIDKINSTKELSHAMLADLFTFKLLLEQDDTKDEGNFNLKLIQNSSFITIPILSIPFSTCTKDEMIHYLHAIIRSYEQEGIGTTSKCYQALQAEHNDEISRLVQENSDAINNIQKTYESQIESLQKQINTLEAASKSTMDEQKSLWEEQLNSLQKENEELTQKMITLTGERDEIESSLNTLKEEFQKSQQQTSQIQQTAEQLAEKEEQEKLLTVELEKANQQIDELQNENNVLKDVEQEYLQLQNTIQACEEELNALHNEFHSSEEVREQQERTISDLEQTIQSLSGQIALLKEDCEKKSTEINVLKNSSKMKDRAISCLNAEINKLKLGSSYLPSL